MGSQKHKNPEIEEGIVFDYFVRTKCRDPKLFAVRKPIQGDEVLAAAHHS